MNDYAPMAGKRERIRLALILAAVILPLALVSHWWLLPALTRYARFANCYIYGDHNGMELLIYGALVVFPLSFALILLLILGPRSLRIIRAGQDPLPGEKVLRKTRYRYGRAAMLLPAMTAILVLVCIGFSIWGGFQVDKLTGNIPPCSERQKTELGIND